MSSFVEWVQCSSCGRRHRWQAEIAGRNIKCGCGERVFVPEVDVAGEQTDPDATIIETVDSPTAASPVAGEVLDIGGFNAGSDLGSLQRAKGGGVLGLGVFGEVILFFCFALLGFILLAHALIVQMWWYIVLAVLFTPLSFWKFNKKRKAWQGNRSFGRAMRETIDTE